MAVEVSQVRARPLSLDQTPTTLALLPNDGPMDRPVPDTGRYFCRNCDHSITRPPTSVHAPASGAEAAAWVRSSAPNTAETMNTVPPRMYRLASALGSP